MTRLSIPANPQPGHSARTAAAVEYLALTGIKGLGDKGIAHILAQVRRNGGTVRDLFNAVPKRLQAHYGLHASAARILCRHTEQLMDQAAKFWNRANALGIAVIAPGEGSYPARLDEFYEGEPPLLYVCGNLGLLSTPSAAVVNSAKPTAETLELSLGLASRLAEAGRTLVVGTESPSYNVVGLAAKRAAGSAIVVLHEGLLTALEQGPDREPLPLPRWAGKQLDPSRTLLVSPFRLDGRWQMGNGPRRDKLVVALADCVVAVETKAGGTIERLCRDALRLGRRMFACQFVQPPPACANDSLIADGTTPLVADPVGSNVDLVLAADVPRPSAGRFEGDGLERRRSLGQFFTPRQIAEFIWEMVELMRGRKWCRKARVIDPACGEGVFIRVAIERGHPAENCFGVDIDETLLPLWRSDSRFRGARLFRTNGLLDNSTIGLVPGTFDLVIGNPPFSGKGLKDLLRLVNLPDVSRSTSQRSLFGDAPDEEPSNTAIPVGSPLAPYEHTIRDYMARQLSRYMCWRLREESEEVIDAGLANNGIGTGLFADLDLSGDRPVRASDYERMFQAVAAWPADLPLDIRQPEVRDTLRRLASTTNEVFFTERFAQLAKPGGMVAVIVPESILASDQLAPLRSWLMQEIQLLAVVSLPQNVFTGVGAKAKTGIVFARRYAAEEQQANAQALAAGRLAEEFHDRKVLLTTPNADSDQQSLADYLASVIDMCKRVIGSNTGSEIIRDH